MGPCIFISQSDVPDALPASFEIVFVSVNPPTKAGHRVSSKSVKVSTKTSTLETGPKIVCPIGQSDRARVRTPIPLYPNTCCSKTEFCVGEAGPLEIGRTPILPIMPLVRIEPRGKSLQYPKGEGEESVGGTITGASTPACFALPGKSIQVSLPCS